MDRFAQMHNDYLDPDRYFDDMPIVENAIAEKDLVCPGCGETAEWYKNETFPNHTNDLTSPEIDAGWHCEHCEWEQECVEEDYDRLIAFNREFKPRIQACWDAIHNHKSKPVTTTPEEFFADLEIPEGDFKWDDCEAGDWHVYCCGENDCPCRWHTIAFALEIGRRDGKLYLEVSGVDSDGNWDHNYGWEEGGDLRDFQECIDAGNFDSFFRGWAQYWLDAIETHKDPCDQIMTRVPEGEWVEFCLKAAEDNVKYLKM